MNTGLSDAMPPHASPFATTHWSVVLCAGEAGSPAAEAALEKLCRTYWPPLYAFVRRSGHSQADAEDLTQGFFYRLLSEGRFGYVSRSRGRFRTFLLSSMKHYLINEWRRNAREKRGFGAVHLSFNCDPEEALYAREPATSESPERLFERRWATRLIEHVFDTVRSDYARSGQTQVFDAIVPVIWGDVETQKYAEISTQLGTTEGALKVAVYRARQRFRDRIRDAVAATLPDPTDAAEVHAELQHLEEVLKGVSPTCE